LALGNATGKDQRSFAQALVGRGQRGVGVPVATLDKQVHRVVKQVHHHQVGVRVGIDDQAEVNLAVEDRLSHLLRGRVPQGQLDGGLTA
jgi:hypothetical protein